ncbi:MAG: chemotaxis-specific protein-glutamate methyltransferase CheB [Lachnospiraceae bacterium]|nr:chemotaxis-specific protein-glutamate methyltransferase CheB [Lachnospiraceae bacterium]
MKNILVVDDSALMRRVISDIIQSDDRLTVKDTAANGLIALELITKNKYDLMLLDVNMPKMTGLELLGRMQENNLQVKTIMVSTTVKDGTKETILALERGAFDFVTKPEDYLGVKDNKFKEILLSTVAAALGISDPAETDLKDKGREERATVTVGAGKTEKRGASVTDAKVRYIPVRPPRNVKFAPHKKYTGSKERINKLVAIASSTGGPKSLQSVITKLPKNLDAPVLIVQHMPKGFTASLAARLDEISPITVKEAVHDEVLRKGCVYIAPGGAQMRVAKCDAGYKIAINSDEPARDGLKPCANILYESLIGSKYDEITCVVLTGMGADGTMGIGLLGETNPVHVISQDEQSCIVYGMPKAIAEAGIVDKIVGLEDVASEILKNVGVLNNGR